MRHTTRAFLLQLFVLLAFGGGCECGRLFGRQKSDRSEAVSPLSSGQPRAPSDTGEAGQWSFRRLGPEGLATGSTVFEVRSILPRQNVQKIDVELHKGCVLDLGVTTRDDRSQATFHVSFLDSRGSVLQRFARTIKGSLFWHDLSIPVETAQPVRELRLEIEEAIGGKALWSRPHELCAPSGRTKPRLNVILVSLDTLRADRLGVWGNPDGLTPNLDRVAGQGTVFTNAYATYPNTVVSHASLFTGLYPHASRSDNDHKEPRLHPGVETLAQRFAARGYVTGAITEDGFVGSAFGFKRGFDTYDDSDNKEDYLGYAENTFQKALGWLKRYGRVPFFLFIHTYEVHAPYSVSPEVVGEIAKAFPGYRGRRFQRFSAKDCSLYNIGKFSLDKGEIAWLEQMYDEETRRLDAVVGRFLAGLGQMGLDRNTLLVLFSDHGEEFSEHGFLGHGETLHRQALQVPLIFWAPDRVPRGRRFDQPVSLIDVGPTVAELAKVGPVFSRTPARSRVGWMSEKPEEAMPPVFSELAFRRASCDAGALLLESCPYRAFSLRDERYTFIHVSTSNLEQLFDRQKDPDEGQDIAAARPALLRRFRDLLQEYRNSEQPPPLIDAASSRLDEETRRKLRALGYIE